MRITALALISVAAVGCGGEDTSLNGVFPASGFIGRSMRVQVSADNTSFSTGTSVDFGPGITVESVTVASPTALFADIVISADTAPGLHDVVVRSGDTLTLAQAFEVESPIRVEFSGTLAQGSLASFTVTNLDFENPFDDTCTLDAGFFGCLEYGFINFETPAGTNASLSSLSPYELTGTLYMDIDAASGPFRINSGDPAGEPVVSSLGADTEIVTRTASALSSTPANGSIEAANGTALYSFTAGANTVSTIDVNGASGAYVLGASGSWTEVVTVGEAPSFVTQTGGDFYVVVTDVSGDENVTFSVAAEPTTLTPVAEADTNGANDTLGGAQDLATNVSALVTNASITDDSDEDWYKFTVPAGSSTKRVHVITAPGDAETDTLVEIYAANGTTLLGEGDDAGYHEDVVSEPLGSNNTFFVKVSPSSYWDAMYGDKYIVAIWLE